jgi:hypothetical protein
MRGDTHGPGSAAYDFNIGKAFLTEAARQCVGVFFSGNGDYARMPALCLFKYGLQVIARSDADKMKAVGVSLDYAKSAAANGAGRTQNSDIFHL